MSDPIPDSPPTLPDPGFQPGLPAFALCGFAAPSLAPFLKYKIPAIPVKPPFPPPYLPGVQFNCSLSNPLSIGGTLPPGGGRVGVVPPDPDDDYDDVGSDVSNTP